MDHSEVMQFVGMLMVVLTAGRLAGALAQRLGQPAVLGELIAGVLVGPSLCGWVDPDHQALKMLSELGVVMLLFAIGMETDLTQLVRVGATSMTVAVCGVVVPFVLGYAACRLLGQSDLRSIMAAATLTATSVGITARVLSDLGYLRSVEGQIILGAALIDDVLGLLLLTIIEGLSEGHAISVGLVLGSSARAFGFLIAAAAASAWGAPVLSRLTARVESPGTLTVFAVILALALSWLAEWSGSAMIIGAFSAGLILSRMTRLHEVERGITTLGHFFVPIFFVLVGAAVNVAALSPATPDGRYALFVGCILIVLGIAGKLAAGYAPFWFRGNKLVVGVGMIPRGEVGLIFARIGLAAGVFDAGLFGAATLMVIVTTLAAPPALKCLLRKPDGERQAESEEDSICDLATRT